MIRRPPRSTLDRSSAASDVYKRQLYTHALRQEAARVLAASPEVILQRMVAGRHDLIPVSYTHLRAHETVLDLVCRLLLEKKKHNIQHHSSSHTLDFT